ncbi:MAG: Fur family transcriptional regulator [Actinomycetota bacterium]
MKNDVHDAAAERLRRAGQRYSANREALVETLRNATKPLTIPEILKTNRTLPMSSAYRNLAILEQAGVVHRIVTRDEFARYELAEDLTTHHHHLICVSCGGVEDFTAPSRFEESATSALGKVASKAGFTIRSHRLDVLGLCKTCA